ncbi:hypothetical protein [Phormidesmis priestleyi]|uniref:hypothetical protein n=1 Tax=Phormidesmis priestleyi TaxID=268141 RepID=UPI00083B3FCA|nr:hypothetical protein [Phormidesmis priestleyi]
MNRFLSVAGKLVGSLFLCGGGTVTIGLLIGMAAWHPTGWAMVALWVPTVVFGLAPSAIGGFLLYGSSKAHRHALRERFFQLLQSNRGRVSLLDFATATRLEPAIARRHLDEWAKDCYATFDVTDGGDVYYVFSADPIALPGDARAQELRRAVREFVRSW